MLNKTLKLSSEIFKRNIEEKSTRDGFGDGLIEVAENHSDLCVITADLRESTRVDKFAKKFPSRYFDVGVSEQALASIASGMALSDKKVFITSFAVFSPGRNWEQIRTTIALNDSPVVIVGSHAGLSASADGASHQALEDISIIRSIPNISLVSPSDYFEAVKVVSWAVQEAKPVYIRLFREPTAVYTTQETPFKAGEMIFVWESKKPEAAIIASGPLVYEALSAAKKLEKEGIEVMVLNCHTVKPLDKQTLIHAAKITGGVVTVEEHQIAGGMGSAVSEVLSANFPVPIEFLGVDDNFGESGTYKQLKNKHNLNQDGICSAVKRIIKRKSQ